jgi:hypothetical protein
MDYRAKTSHRSPLTRQAAWQNGLAAFFTSLVGFLLGWATWNIAADQYFLKRLGPKYWADIPTEPPK